MNKFSKFFAALLVAMGAVFGFGAIGVVADSSGGSCCCGETCDCSSCDSCECTADSCTCEGCDCSDCECSTS